MSINGRDVLSQIESRRSAVRSEKDSRSSQLAELQGQHASASAQLQQAYQTLVHARTEDGGVKRSALSEIDGWLAQQYAARQAEGRDLVGQFERVQSAANAAGLAKKQCAQAVQEAQDAWDGAREAARTSLSQEDATFIDASRRHADAVRRSQAVDEHLQEMSANTQAFSGACDTDPLFVYCARRKVGASDSVGNFITRPLDRIVARISGYYKHHQLLLDAQADLEQWVRHQALLHAELSDAKQAVEACIDASLQSPVGQSLQRSLADAQSFLDNARRAEVQANEELSKISTQKQAFDQERDERAVQMRDRVLQAVSNASSQDLARAAAETVDQEDDRAAELAATLRRTLPDLEKSIEQASSALSDIQAQDDKLSKLVSQFKSQGYDGRYSRFDYGFDTDTLVAGVLLGRMSVGQALGSFGSAHRDVTPPPPPPPSPSISPSSDSGFSSGGGFGGVGGFSTGGGF